ncbi:MAG: hypothetical protein IPM97_10900 [Bdellovibrionaceae bacterium]|nr:hypothetical protein [Pseudobdellovibrionaceae bacterium]
MRFYTLALLFPLLSLFIGSSSLAEKEGILSKLLAPGPLIKGHQDLEDKDCLKCHDAGKGVPNEKCLDCHKQIKPFVEQKRGFHGLTDKNCMECHREHKGRDFDSMAIDEKKFDHKKLTGYDLEGKHADIKCTECHKNKLGPKYLRPGDTQYFGNTSTCISCHKKDDVHFFKGNLAKKDCNACHGIKTWKDEIKFDHTRDGNYKLTGKHAEAKCNDCHLTNKNKKIFTYKWPQLKTAKCLTCHEDAHKANLSSRFRGGNCTACHTEQSWKIQTFDHKITGYKLNGRHVEIDCVECHKQNPTAIDKESKKNYKWVGLNKKCLSCHDDFHRFGNAKNPHFGDLNNCIDCHTEKKWTPAINFNHNKHTRYVIDGAHIEVKCKDCHTIKTTKMPIYKFPNLSTKTCENCHKSPHVGVFSKELLKKQCTVCHTTDSWSTHKSNKGFDHSKTRFPLTGAHISTKCNDCHGPAKKQIFKFKSADLKFCVDCHKNIHTNQFSKIFSAQSCTLCHDTKTFKDRLPFDHDKTQYKLKGAHAELKCQDCHTPIDKFSTVVEWPNINKKESPRTLYVSKFLYPDLKQKQCLSCHQDYHQGQLSTKCADCHNEKKWKPTSFNHDMQSDFPLKYKHAEVKCSECHKNTNQFITYKKISTPVVRYKPLSSQCVDCHKDPHKGTLGSRCQECHIEKGWKITRDFHKNFSLTGVHYALACAECHKDGRKLAGMSQQCYTCHQKDDVHSGTLPNCSECHTQHLWELSRFKHSLTNFPLRGAHRTLDCMTCHKEGAYKGLSSQCVSCYMQDYNANLAVTQHNGNFDCAACHRNQFNFGNVQ